MRVLLIAPTHPDLPDQPREVADLESVLDVKTVRNGEKTLLAAIHNAHFDGVWISSHANAEYVMLEDGERLDAGALAQYLVAVGADWVVINSCESYEFVDRVQRYYPVDVVAASIKSLGDRPAWRTAALIARHLARTQDLREALRLASPGGAAPYRFWPAPQDVEEEPRLVALEKRLTLELTAIRGEIQRCQLEAQRESQTMLARLVTVEGRIEIAETMAEAIKDKLEKIARPEPALSPRTVRQAVIGIYLICALLFLILAVLSVSGGP